VPSVNLCPLLTSSCSLYILHLVLQLKLVDILTSSRYKLFISNVFRKFFSQSHLKSRSYHNSPTWPLKGLSLYLDPQNPEGLLTSLPSLLLTAPSSHASYFCSLTSLVPVSLCATVPSARKGLPHLPPSHPVGLG
jgi:hypothetical protein